jgi:2-polyprenyl-3-methyl-5-hydroxy-6-metoxy-1,4-benzoquinol methylase
MDGGSDHAYASTNCVWGVEPEPLLAEFVSSRPIAGWRVLDAGCGEGRNTALLARSGARVRALDVSELALDHARRTWPDLEGVSWELADLRRVNLPKDHYDLVVLDSVLHWMADATDADRVLRRLWAATRPGGWHLMCTFDDRHQELTGHVAPPRFIPSHHWCVTRYEDWYLETVRAETIVSAHAGAPEPHGHSVTKLLARRPGAD